MLPLPLISKDFQGADLMRLYLSIDRARPDPQGAPPGLIVSFPPAWGNKYQVLLYSTAMAHRTAVVGLRGPADLDRISWPGPVVLHAHWFTSLFNAAASEAEAMALFEEARASILRFRDRTGARLLWTAHNVFPHGQAFPEAALALRRWVFETFDALHLLHEGHRAVLEERFDRRAPPHFTVPHMSYRGIMPDVIGREAARAFYGIAPDRFVFGLFGSIQPYKRIPAFLAALEPLAARRPVHALVGGLPSDPDEVRAIAGRWGAAPWLTFLPKDVLDHEVQYIHRAADLMVLPYADTLNSGAAFMAATFGRPCLMPRGQAAAGMAGLGLTTFDPDRPGGLGAALAQAMEGPLPETDPQALAAIDPARISEAFMARVTALMRPGPAA